MSRVLQALGFLLLVFGSSALFLSVEASQTSYQLDWPPPQRIPFYDDGSEPPKMAADGERVHAFNSVRAGERLIIVYSSWTAHEGWSAPVDVFLPPFKDEARIGGVYLDRNRTLHVVFFSGDDLEATIYYAQAPAAVARDANAWTTPEPIGRKAITPTTVDIIGDGQDNLYVVYSGREEGQGLYSVHSADLGLTWEEPSPVFLTHSETLWPIHLSHYVDPERNAYVVWGVGDPTGNSRAVYFARSLADEATWSLPLLIAREEGFEADWPSLTSYGNTLILIYQNGAPATRWMQRSVDRGETWSEPTRPFPHIGSYGAASLITDNSGTLHMFLGNRIGSPAVHGMWHSVWEDGEWLPLEPVVSGPASKDPRTAFDPDNPQTVLLGNTVLLSWINDPGLNGVWFTATTVDAVQGSEVSQAQDEATVGAMPATEPEESVIQQPLAATPAGEQMVQEAIEGPDPAEEEGSDQMQVLLVSLMPTMAVIGAVAIVMILRHRAWHPRRNRIGK